jgi:hypothetical protein
MSKPYQIAAPVSPSRPVWTALIVLCLIAVGAVVRRLVALFAVPAAGAVPQLAALDAAFAARRVLTLIHIVPALLFVLLLPAGSRAGSGIMRPLTAVLRMHSSSSGRSPE